MKTSNDVHHQLASFFGRDVLAPYAYLVSKKLSEGHICLHLKNVADEIKTVPFYKDRTLGDPILELTAEPIVSSDDQNKQPFRLHNNRLYLQRYFQYETIILDRLRDFAQTERVVYGQRVEQLMVQKPLVDNLFGSGEACIDFNGEKTDWQLAAALSVVLNDFTIITGGPGTGKTTTVAKVLALLFSIDQNLSVALAAPTGKAAARMAESLKNARLPVEEDISSKFNELTPSTIHRLLRSIPESPYFRYNGENPLPHDVVIIDESSMIDVALFAKLLAAIGPQTRLIMLGDKDQLASVEAGSLFGDLCQAREELNTFSPERIALINGFIKDKGKQISAQQGLSSDHPLFQRVVELRFSHRFKGNAGIGRFSKAVIRNDREVIGRFIATPDSEVIIDQEYSKEVYERFISGYEAYINEPDTLQALRKFNNLRVLCAVREGEQGVYMTNKRIEEYLHKKKLISRSGEFYENRPVIVTHNYYNLGLFNGDIGILRKDETGVLKAWFEDSDGTLKSVLPGYLSQSETVYAMTIHKSQGSEFDQVLVVMPQVENNPLLTRELLYTAVTRARKKVWVQGRSGILLQTAGNKVQRGSGIIERFLDK